MTDSTPVRCCRRPLTVIGVDHGPAGVQLLSCATCGRHSWQRDGREVERSELLDVLRVTRTPGPPPSPAAAPEPAPRVVHLDAPSPEAARREELRQMLAGFTVHGTAR